MQKHQWVRSAYTLTCLVSSNLIISQAFLTNTLASEAVNDLIQSSDKIKSSTDGNNAAGSSTQQLNGNNATDSTAPQPPVNSAPASNTPQQTEGNNAFSNGSSTQQPSGNNATGNTAPQPTVNSTPVSNTPQPTGNNAFSNGSSTQQPSGNNASRSRTRQTSGNSTSRRVRFRQTGNSTAGSDAQSRVPAVKKLNFTDVAFGVLAPGNPQSQGRYVHLYQFEGRENQLVQVRLVGSNDDRPTNNLSLKPYLVLLDPNNRVVSRRGSEGADGQLQQAFMPVRLPLKGTYTIAVTSEEPGAIGRYSLALREDRGSYALDQSGELSSRSITSLPDSGSSKPAELQVRNAPSSDLNSRLESLPDSGSSKPAELQVKNAPSSDLNSRLESLPDPGASKHFELQGKKNQLVNIRVDSTTEQFHPYAVLMNSKAQVIAMSEATDSKYTASIDRAILPQDDKYYVVVNSATPQTHGKYRLTVY